MFVSIQFRTEGSVVMISISTVLGIWLCSTNIMNKGMRGVRRAHMTSNTALAFFLNMQSNMSLDFNLILYTVQILSIYIYSKLS